MIYCKRDTFIPLSVHRYVKSYWKIYSRLLTLGMNLTISFDCTLFVFGISNIVTNHCLLLNQVCTLFRRARSMLVIFHELFKFLSTLGILVFYKSRLIRIFPWFFRIKELIWITCQFSLKFCTELRYDVNPVIVINICIYQ